LGELEAQAAAAYLKQYPIVRVFSSPLQRAIYGAEQVRIAQVTTKTQATNNNSSQQQQPVTQLAGLKELDRGAWAGQTTAEIGPENLARFDACDESITPADGGESYTTLKARVLHARDEVLRQLQEGEIGCVVSHLQVTRCIVSDALGIPTAEMAGLKIATASVTCMDYYYTDDDDDDENKKEQKVHFQSFKPEAGLAKAKDGAN
jgi:broad specificity phosphatase PhoE